MKGSVLVTFLVGVFGFTFAQNERTLDTDYIRKHVSYFTIKNNEIRGDGRFVLDTIAKESQFVVYGEMHGSEQTSVLTKAFIPILADAGFKHFAIEVGPHSAEKLSELTTPAEKTVENLKGFNSKYTVVQGDEVAVPIPFFTSISDAEFLKEARLRNMSLWGLDQEFYFSTFFLMDALTQTTVRTKNYDSIMALHKKAQGVMYQYFMAEFKEEIESAYAEILKEPIVQDYFHAFDKSNTKAQAMIKNMMLSWDIYINWRNDSHVDRISYMRQNFMTNYHKALNTEKNPKVFTKIGSLHAKKTISNGAYDIGELTEALAKKNGTIATSISSWRAFEKDENGNVINSFERYKRGYKRYAIFFPLAKEDAFAIINLKHIRNAIESNEIELPQNGDYHKLRSLIYGYDYHIILPLDQEPVPNRTQ